MSKKKKENKKPEQDIITALLGIIAGLLAIIAKLIDVILKLT